MAAVRHRTPVLPMPETPVQGDAPSRGHASGQYVLIECMHETISGGTRWIRPVVHTAFLEKMPMPCERRTAFFDLVDGQLPCRGDRSRGEVRAGQASNLEQALVSRGETRHLRLDQVLDITGDLVHREVRAASDGGSPVPPSHPCAAR